MSSNGSVSRRTRPGEGGRYQTLINLALREYIAERTEPLEDKIRRVVREEVAKYGESTE